MRVAFVLAVLSCAACRVEKPVGPPIESSIPESPESPEPEPVATPDRLAMPALPCSVEFGPEDEEAGITVIVVAGQRTPLEFDPYEDNRLVAYPAGEGEVLVAFGHDAPWLSDRTSTSGETLWRVRCSEPSKPEPALELEGANFPWSVLALDHQHIYFTYQGVQSYAIATGKFEPLIAPLELGQCWEEEARDSDEFVAGWHQPGELLVLSGGPCGFEAQWQGERQIVSDFQDPNQPAKRRTPAWIGTVVAGAGDRVWVADGGQCLLDFPTNRPGTPGAWRSDDAGANWTFLPLAGGEAGIQQLWPSASDPNRVLAMTECCHEAAGCDQASGGSLFLTTDGGTTWKKIRDESGESGLEGVVVDEAKHEITAFGGADGTVVSRDDGRTWKPSSAKLEKPTTPPTRVEIGGFVLEKLEIGGLERRDPRAAAGTGQVVVLPSPNQPK